MHDVFICHASEDKENIAQPLAERLRASGLNVWYDKFSLTLGDSLRESIDRGLSDSRFGVVIFSPNFFAKKWPQAELNGLFAKEIAGDKTIIPVWHNITQAEILHHSPILADRVAAQTAEGLDAVLDRILETIEPGLRHKTLQGRTISVSPTSIRLHNGEWSVETPVLVTNRADSPLYAVTVKISVEGIGVSSDSLEIKTGEKSTSLRASTGPYTMSADTLRLNCKDMQGREVVFVILHTVHPGDKREVTVRGTTPINSTAAISVASFDQAPQELLRRQGNEIALLFKAPESVWVKGMGVMLWRS